MHNTLSESSPFWCVSCDGVAMQLLYTNALQVVRWMAWFMSLRCIYFLTWTQRPSAGSREQAGPQDFLSCFLRFEAFFLLSGASGDASLLACLYLHTQHYSVPCETHRWNELLPLDLACCTASFRVTSMQHPQGPHLFRVDCPSAFSRFPSLRSGPLPPNTR